MTPKSLFETEGVPNVLPRGPHGLDREVVLASQRGRLLTAFVEQAAEKGYNQVTIADIVRHAGTAKRTFYQHFADKQDCFIQAFEVASAAIITEIVRAGDATDDPIKRIEVGVSAYLEAMSEMPYFAQLFLTESLAAGPEIAARWMGWIELLADGIVGWRDESREKHPEIPPLTRRQAIGVISALNELVRFEILRNGVDSIGAIADELVDLAIGLLTADVAPRPHHL
ncbi:MAG: TetR/AcrR family transcriptional regulator [Actinobacteria bacterium]|nr:TetR/AcrR family transcriptional regulator [Actinomycetota bacterium]